VPPDPDLDALYRTPADGFAELADTYDARLAGNPALLLESAAVLASLPDLSGARVADLGCGTGRYALQLARFGAREVAGIDLSPEMLRVARRKSERSEDGPLPVTWREGDLCGCLPAEDNTFDAAVCALVVSFLPELAEPFHEIARVLRPGGTLVVSDLHPHGLCAARAASAAVGRRDHAPYLRFTAASGEEWRITRTPHTAADWFAAAQNAGLVLEQMAEPLADRRLASTYPTLRDQVGVPLALVMRFRRRREEP
jgi:malonyl-CoA O-methyltransferase